MPAKLNLSPEEYQERRRAQWRRFRDKWNVERNPMLYGPHLPRKGRKALMDRLRNAKLEVKARRREVQKARYEKLSGDPAVKEKRRQQGRETHRRDPSRALAGCRLRQAAKLRATPPWLTQEMKQEMRAMYREAKRLAEEHGISYHVDHIEPLRGVDACGLHVPWNLQILTGPQNLSKGNRRDD